MIRWHDVVLAAVLGVTLAAAAAQAVPSDQSAGRTPAAGEGPMRPDVRVQMPSGPAPADVRVWINGREVAAADPTAPDRKTDRPEPDGATYLGVIVSPLSARAKEIAKVETGVLVTQVMPGSPAAKVDIRPDDVITAVGNTAIGSPQQLADCVRQYRVSEKVRVIWFRDGKRMQDTVTLAAMPAERPSSARPSEPRQPEARPPESKDSPPGEAYMGIVGGPMTGDMAEIAGVKRGVVIRGLTEGSPAAKAGLQAGDVITSVDGKDIVDPGALVEIVRTRKAGDVLRVVYYRMGRRLDANVRLGSRPPEAGRPGEGRMPGAPDEFPGVAPEMRKYLEGMRPQIEEWLKQFEGQGMPRPARPMVPPGGTTEPYDVGKDMGRILERLEQLDRRLGDIEKRLDQLEKKK